jgi:hypothetical protein
MITLEDSRSVVDECTKLTFDFARFVDAREIDRVELFTSDATFERKGETLRGQTEIRAAQNARLPGVTTRHVCANTYIDIVDEDHARGIVYFTIYHHDGPPNDVPVLPLKLESPQTVGKLYDEYVRTASGWRIARRESVPAFRR